MSSLRFIPLLLMLAYLAGCGRTDSGGYRLGELRSFSPSLVGGSERHNLTQLCQALASKGMRLPQMINTPMTFAVATKGCEEEGLGDALDIAVLIQRSGQDEFIFKQSANGQDFVYRDLETHTSGIMGHLCQNLQELTHPLRLPNGSALWFSTLAINASDCSTTGQERCIQLDLGIPQGDGFVITSREWIKFQIDPNQSGHGFFNERRTIARSLCRPYRNTETHARLK
jgi:hypothetical protein